jgi:hypothetical protein
MSTFYAKIGFGFSIFSGDISFSGSISVYSFKPFSTVKEGYYTPIPTGTSTLTL